MYPALVYINMYRHGKSYTNNHVDIRQIQNISLIGTMHTNGILVEKLLRCNWISCSLPETRLETKSFPALAVIIVL